MCFLGHFDLVIKKMEAMNCPAMNFCYAGKLTSHRIPSDLDFHMYFMWQVVRKRRDPQRKVPLELLFAIVK